MKQLEICWENGFNVQELDDFLGLEVNKIPPQQVDRSSRTVYNGNNSILPIPTASPYQTWWHAKRHARRVLKAIRHRLSPNTSRDSAYFSLALCRFLEDLIDNLYSSVGYLVLFEMFVHS